MESRSTGREAIGATQRGIGPCYRDKYGRTVAIRLGDLYRANIDERIAQIDFMRFEQQLSRRR